MDGNTQILLAIIAVVASMVGLLAFVVRAVLVPYLQQILRVARSTERHVNHVEEDIEADGHGGKITLGQRAKIISDDLSDMKVQNAVEHARIWDKIEKLPPRWLLERIDRMEERHEADCAKTED